jgi:integrase
MAKRRYQSETAKALATTRQAEPSQLVANYTAAAQSNATTRAYAAGVRHFTRNGGAIPATPQLVAEYLAKFAGVLAAATLQHRVVAIHRAHVDAGFSSPIKDPLVARTLQGIRRSHGTTQRRVAALVKDDMLELVVHIERKLPMRAARDKALLLLGFAGAFRRSELTALEVEDITKFENGLELRIRRSKTDQEGAGRTVFIPRAVGKRCPVKAIAEWLTIAGISYGPLFLRIDRHDRILGTAAITPQTVALLVKSYVREMRGAEAAKHVAGHSLRSGFVTAAAMAGLQPYQIREQTGHKSDATLARYIRPVNKRKLPSLL